MKSLRNIAVRMRPPVQVGNQSHEAQPMAAATPAAAPPMAPPHPASGEPQMPGGGVSRAPRQIWELEAEFAPPHEVAAPAARSRSADAMTGMPQPRSPLPTPPSALPASAAAAKTRILGFHAQEMQRDAFAVAREAGTAPRFPAGWLVVIDGPGRGAHFAVTTHVSSIGRDPEQDVALDFGDTSISRNSHAAVVYDAEQNRFFLGQGNKANVVRRNGQPVLATEEMFDGDLIRIGKTTLRFAAFCGADFTWGQTEPDAGGIDHG